MKQNHTKHVYFSYFNPLKVTGELKIENLGWVHGTELGGGKLAMGPNRYHSFEAEFPQIAICWSIYYLRWLETVSSSFQDLRL